MSVRLFILGIACGGETHGYEIKEIAKRWGVERWAKFGFGSIYHALGKLQEEGLLLECGTTQDGNRPPRYVYKITEEGTEAFFSLLRETCQTADAETRDIDMALAFIHFLPPDERVSLLTQRLANLEPRYQSLTENLAAYEANTHPEIQRINREVPWVAHGVRHSLGRVAFEREWMQSVLKTVADWPCNLLYTETEAEGVKEDA
jgi:DNA-binding PadR family transcriptional regulator